VSDRAFFFTQYAMRRQLAAMPNELYLVRLIRANTRVCRPGERVWSAGLLTQAATVRFLRARNREDFDIYVHASAGRCNAGYILVDLDGCAGGTIADMRAHSHEPCVVVETSPGPSALRKPDPVALGSRPRPGTGLGTGLRPGHPPRRRCVVVCSRVEPAISSTPQACGFFHHPRQGQGVAGIYREDPICAFSVGILWLRA